MITEGVAKNVFLGQNISVAGKTGTAQEREDRGNHAVFVSYAPYEDPQYVITMVIEHGGHGGSAAGPKIAQIYNKLVEMGYINLEKIQSDQNKKQDNKKK